MLIANNTKRYVDTLYTSATLQPTVIYQLAYNYSQSQIHVHFLDKVSHPVLQFEETGIRFPTSF